MKKFLAILTITAAMAACNNAAEQNETPVDTVAATPATPAPDTTAEAAAPAAPKDSLMQFKEGKVMIVTAGTWSALSAPVTTSNGRVVKPNGEVSKGGKTRKLEEGMMIDKDGQMTDKDGKPLDTTGW